MRYLLGLYRLLLICLLSHSAVVADAVPAAASPPSPVWVKITSPNFELLTNSSEEKGQKLLSHFERIRSFFLTTSGASEWVFQPISILQTALPGRRWHPSWPVRIVAFASNRDYRQYTASAALAYHLRGLTRDYIVMGSLESEVLPVAVHEYVHVMISQSGADLPLWLNEGLATLYSTLRFTGQAVEIGESIPGLFEALQRSTVDLDKLTSATRTSPFYTREPDRNVYYGQSWALVHMLSLSKMFPPIRFNRCIQILASGRPPAEAFQEAYGLSLGQIGSALRVYRTSDSFAPRKFETTMGENSIPMDTRRVSPLESGFALGELLTHLGRKDKAEQLYKALEKENPKSGEIAVALGRIEFSRGRYTEATRYFDRAKELGAKDASLDRFQERSQRAAEYENQRLILEQALNSKEKTLGQNHPDVAEPLKKLAEFHLTNEELTEAETYYRRALVVEEGAHGIQAPAAAKMRHQLGLLDFRQRRYDEAEACFLRSLATLVDHPDTDLAWTLRVLTDLGLVYAIQQRDAEAEAVLRRVLSMRTETLGRDHYETTLSMEHLARILKKVSQNEEAEFLQKQSFTARSESVKQLSTSIPEAEGRHPPDERDVRSRTPEIRTPRASVWPLPRYTDEARKAGVGGTILFTAVIGIDGRAYNMVLLEGLGFGLDESAAETVLTKWRFVPAELDGKSVPLRCRFEVSFKLY